MAYLPSLANNKNNRSTILAIILLLVQLYPLLFTGPHSLLGDDTFINKERII